VLKSCQLGVSGAEIILCGVQDISYENFSAETKTAERQEFKKACL
jgi:hypothetical protein